MRGNIICLEGNDRVGKHTQSLLLAEYIRENGYNVKTISFPNYGKPQASPVEKYLAGGFSELSPIEASMLYAFDRSITLREMHIKEFLKKGGVLILDRYTPSNVVFQTARALKDCEDIDIKSDKAFKTIYQIETLEYSILELPRPNAVVYLNLDRENQKYLMDGDDEIKGVKNDIHESDPDLLDRVSQVGVQLAELCDWILIDCFDKENHKIYSKEEILKKIIKGLAHMFLGF